MSDRMWTDVIPGNMPQPTCADYDFSRGPWCPCCGKHVREVHPRVDAVAASTSSNLLGCVAGKQCRCGCCDLGAGVSPTAEQIAKQPEQVLMAGGKAASTRVTPLHLIPTVALESLAERFALGIQRKGDRSWNAISNNQEVLDDLEFAIDRCGHAMLHAMQLRDKLRNKDVLAILKDDDAGAIAWAGAFLACVVRRLVDPKNENG